MKRIRSVALVCAGPISRGRVARLPGLVDHLGWIKAPSFRLASRAVNVLRAGVPVNDYEELDPADLIVVSVPRELEDCTIADLASSRIDWRHRAAVLLDTEKESSALKPLLERGALLATLLLIGAAEDWTLVIEGRREAVKLMRRALTPRVSQAMQVITTAGKARLLAGIDEATRGFFPAIASVTDHFKSAGLSKSQSEVLAQGLMISSMRSYFRAGRRVLSTAIEKTASVRSVTVAVLCSTLTALAEI